MTEDPIKLLARRSQRFPQADDGDTLRAAIERGIEQVPVFGPATSFVMSRFWVPGATRRLEEWLKEFADDFDRHCKSCSVENLVQDEAFISASIQAARIAVGTHRKEKREYLRNALLNIAIGKAPDEVKQQMFLNAIEAFTPAHVQALDLIWRAGGVTIPWDGNSIALRQRTYGTAVGLLVPEVAGQPSLIGAIFADLRNRGFSTLGGPDQSFPQGGLMTNLGVEFMTFVMSPGEDSQ
jgi:hypothetical protein